MRRKGKQLRKTIGLTVEVNWVLKVIGEEQLAAAGKGRLSMGKSGTMSILYSWQNS